MIWATVLVASLGTYIEKAAGYVLPARLIEGAAIRRLTWLLPVVLLAALVPVQTFASGQALVIDARVVGLVAAIIALLARAPFLVVVVVAAVTAAILRAAGWGT
jgi:branched-subunit amino acid transport protein